MPPKPRDRAILRSFADRVDAWDAGAHNNLAVLYFTKGMIAEAVASFTRALELDPRMTVAQRNLEIAYFSGGYYDRRVEELDARLQAAPTDRYARWELGRTFFLLGDVARAIDAFGVLLRDDPDDVQVIRQVAMAEAKCGDLEAAARWLHHALEVEPHNPSVLFQLGEVAYHRGHNEEARVALERSVALAPTDADALYLLGFVLGDLGHQEAARDVTARALRLNASLGKAEANLSLERFDARSWQHAREVRQSRGLTEPTADSQMAHLGLGQAFRHKGYLAEALKEYQIALDRGEDAMLVRQAMAETHLLLGAMPTARVLYEQLLDDQPENPRWWNERGVALHHDGQHADALASYERALDADPEYASAWNNLGVAAYHAGDSDRAHTAFEQAAVLEPGLLKAQLNRALLMARMNQPARALSAYRQVLTATPGHAAAWNGVGLVLLELKRFEEARNALSRAVESDPNLAEAHYNLSAALTNLGDHDAALRETQRGLALSAYYTPPQFELAVEIDLGDARLGLSPDIVAPKHEETVREFTFEAQALEALFDELAPVAPEPTTGQDLSSFDVARRLLARGDHDAALGAVRQAMARGADRGEGLRLQGDIYLARGAAGEALERYRESRHHLADPRAAVAGEAMSLRALGRAVEALGAANWLVRHASDDVPALLLAGRVQFEAEDAAAAWDTLQAAVTLAPNDPQVHALLAVLCRSHGDLAGAERALREAMTLAPQDLTLAVELGLLLFEQGQDREARIILEHVVSESPGRLDAVLALARCRRAVGQAAETIELLAAVLAADPYQLDALASLGESLLVLERSADAQFAFERILRFDPDHGAALYFTGVLAAQAHAFDEAIALWERVRALEPMGEYGRRAARDARTAAEWRQHLTRPLHSVEAA